MPGCSPKLRCLRIECVEASNLRDLTEKEVKKRTKNEHKDIQESN